MLKLYRKIKENFKSKDEHAASLNITLRRRCPQNPGGSWKRRNHHRPFWICVCGKLGQGNHVIIVTSSLMKGSVFKLNSDYTNTKIRSFQILPVWRAFSSDEPRFRDGLAWTVGLTVEIKLCFKFFRFDHVKISTFVMDQCGWKA